MRITRKLVWVTACGVCGRIHEVGSRCPRCEERIVERAIIETFRELGRQAMACTARVTPIVLSGEVAP